MPPLSKKSTAQRGLITGVVVLAFVLLVAIVGPWVKEGPIGAYLDGYKEMEHSQQLLMDFAAALCLGVFFIILSHWLRVSAIVFLLIGGILVGPFGLGLVQPEYLGDGLSTIVSLAVGLILFEGGLTLDPKGYRQAAREIRGVLTVGVLITWVVTSVAIRLVFADMPPPMAAPGPAAPVAALHDVAAPAVASADSAIDAAAAAADADSDTVVEARAGTVSPKAGPPASGLPWSICFLAGGLIIVTGPTVIGPLLKRIRVRHRIHNILHWEGVLIDPVGVFVGLFCYEWITGPDGEAVSHFVLRMGVGVVLGLLWGLGMAQIIKRGWIASERLNIAVLASAVANFVIADWLVHESGLLSVTICGLVIGLLDAPEVRRLKVYKAELIELLIGLLFVLLAANLNISAFAAYGWRLVIIVAIVMLLVRPLNIFASTWGTKVSLREKLFLSWIAPRGIVAASMASLFALNLANQENSSMAAYAGFLEPFTYSVIAGTVIIQGFSAGLVGRMTGVLEPRPTGWLIVGAHRLGRQVAKFLERAGANVVLMDTNPRSIQLARRDSLIALQVNALNVDTDLYPQLYGIGNVLAITENAELNTLVCQRWQQEQPLANLYKWSNRTVGDDGENGEATGAASDIEVGHPIWDVVPYGNLRHIDQQGAEGFLYIQTIAHANIRHGERVLMCRAGDEVLPYLPSRLPSGPADVLTYRPFAVRLNLKMDPGSILISEATDMAGVIGDLLAHMASTAGQVDLDALHATLATQEREYSSLIGYGVALPHTYSAHLTQSMVLCAKPRKPIIDQHSGDEIHVVFLVLSPKDDAQNHVNALSEISRFIMDEQNRERLLEATDVQTLVELFFPDRSPDRDETMFNATGVLTSEVVPGNEPNRP